MNHELRHHYRLSKNNPFRGEEWVLFANPDDPEGNPVPGSGPEGEGQAPETGPEPSPDFAKTMGTLKVDLREFLPGKDSKDEQKRMAIQTHWLGLLADYNTWQEQINVWQETRKNIQDDKYVLEDTNFEKKLDQEWRRLLSELKQHKIPVSNDTINKVKAQKKEFRGNILKLIDKAIQIAIEERNKRLERIIEEMKGDLKKRVVNLSANWRKNCPPGYEDRAQQWQAYCGKLLEALEKQTPVEFFSKEANFPEGNDDASIAYKEAKNWWYAVQILEDSFRDFHREATIKNPEEDLEKQFSELEKHIEKELDEELINTYETRLVETGEELNKTIALLQSKLGSYEGEERKMREGELNALRETLKIVEKNKGIKVQVNKLLYSEEALNVVSRAGAENIPLPKGLKGQMDFLKRIPLSGEGHINNSAERVLMRRALRESIGQVKAEIENIKETANSLLPQKITDLKRAREKLNFEQGDTKNEIIWINPIAAFSDLAESIQDTVKGNIETEAKRGSSYFQWQATKFLEKLPEPDGMPGSQVIQSLRELSSNGQQNAESAEHKRISSIQDGYKTYNTEKLLSIASSTNVRWEFKACMNLLGERGRINWYEPWIFTQLNRWQKTIQLPEDPQWHMVNITASDDMMRRAFLYIFRVTDDYKDLKNKNNSAYENKKNEYMGSFPQLSAEQGALKREAERELKQFKEDRENNIYPSTADPIKYEAVVHYAIKEGKMSGEDRLYYLNQGIASGLLPFDRGAVLVAHSNLYPPLDLYDTASRRAERPNIFDVKEWASYDSVSSKYWMHDHVWNHTAVQERLVKTISQGSNRMDHDDAPMIAGYLDAAGIDKMLKGTGQGGFGLPVTGLQSLSEGHQLWLDMFAERKNRMENEKANTELTRFASMFVRYEAILKNRMHKGGDFYRLEKETGEKPSRASGAYADLFGHGSMSMNGRLENIKAYLWMLDYNPGIPFLRRLMSGHYQTDAQMMADARKLNEEANEAIWGKDIPKTMDDAYTNINAYIAYVTKKKPERVANLVSKLKAEHKENEAKTIQKREKAKRTGDGSDSWKEIKTLSERLQEAEEKKQEVQNEAYAYATTQGEGTSAPANNNWFYETSGIVERRAA